MEGPPEISVIKVCSLDVDPNAWEVLEGKVLRGAFPEEEYAKLFARSLNALRVDERLRKHLSERMD